MAEYTNSGAVASVSEDPWSLVSAQRYAEAAEAYLRCFAEGGGPFALRGRAKALLLAGRSAESLQAFLQVIEMTEPEHRGDGDFIDVGICQWYLGQPAEAVAVWRQGLSAPYTDAAGGVVCPAFLLYAGVRLKNDRLDAKAVRILRGHWSKHLRRVRQGPAKTARQAHEDLVHAGLCSWPGVLVPFLLGQISEPELDEAASCTPSDVLRSRWHCQADFFAGVRALQEGNDESFRERMSRCAARPGGELEHEFCLARWEVANDFPAKPFAGTT